ncbi:MAG: hypothetical protein ACR2FO_09775 [Actinomycetota bacterium]
MPRYRTLILPPSRVKKKSEKGMRSQHRSSKLKCRRRSKTDPTTAKITSLHGTLYQQLSASLGDETARIYGEANQAAIARVAQFVEELTIDCDFHRMDSFTYAADLKDLETVEKEASVAQSLGLPASFVTQTDLPFEVRGAVRFQDQALFHPRKQKEVLPKFR